MALNYVWILFFIIGLIIALVKLIIFHDYEIFKKLVEGIFDASKSSVLDIGLPLTGVMVFFMGLMNIGEKAGAINFLARLLNPFMKRLFPEVPDKHPAMGQMVMNFSANMLGLDNAATPFGLKAMESLQTLNHDKETASNSQIMFLVLHTLHYCLQGRWRKYQPHQCVCAIDDCYIHCNHCQYYHYRFIPTFAF